MDRVSHKGRIREKVVLAQVTSAFRWNRLLLANTVIVVLLVFYFLYAQVSPAGATAWMVGMQVVTLFRFLLGRAFLSRDRIAQEIAPWRAGFVALTGVAGFAWGLIGTALYPGIDPHSQLVIAMILLAVCATGLFSQYPVFWAFPTFAIPMLVPFIVLRFLGDTRADLFAGFTGFFFLLIALFTCLLYTSGNKDLNRRWVFVTLKLAQSLLDLPGGVSNIDLTVNDIFAAKDVATRLQAATNLTVESWMTTNAQLLAALRNQTVSNNLIRSFVTIIVALGIASVLVVSVVQKQKEIGILRAMGASSRRIMAVFLLQGGMVGLVGALLGTGLAITLLQVFSHVYRNADGSPLFAARLELRFALLAALVALGVGLLAAVIPARRAAKMDPVQAIRA